MASDLLLSKCLENSPFTWNSHPHLFQGKRFWSLTVNWKTYFWVLAMARKQAFILKKALFQFVISNLKVDGKWPEGDLCFIWSFLGGYNHCFLLEPYLPHFFPSTFINNHLFLVLKCPCHYPMPLCLSLPCCHAWAESAVEGLGKLVATWNFSRFFSTSSFMSSLKEQS